MKKSTLAKSPKIFYTGCMENIITQWHTFKEKLIYLGYWDKLLNHLETIAAIILIGILLFALMNCFLGHQLMRLWMTVIGLGVGGCIGGYLGLRQFHDKNTIFLTAAAFAFAVAIAATLVYRVGLVVLCGGVVFATLELLFPVSSMSVHMGFVALGIVAGIAAFERETIVVTWITAVCGGLAAARAGFLLLGWDSTAAAVIAGCLLAALGIRYQYSQIRKDPPKKRKKNT